MMAVKPGAKGAAAAPYFLEAAGVFNGRRHFQPVADDGCIGEQPRDVFGPEGCNGVDHESAVGDAEPFPFSENCGPTEARLIDLQHEAFEQIFIVLHWETVFLIVIRAVERIASGDIAVRSLWDFWHGSDFPGDTVGSSIGEVRCALEIFCGLRRANALVGLEGTGENMVEFSPGRVRATAMADRQTRVRAASALDVDGLVALFRAVYGDTSHPCKERAFVESTIRSAGFIWRVVSARERIVACSAAVEHAWNRTWEVGRGVTDPEYRSEGIGTELCGQCVAAACEMPGCDLVHGYPRNATVVRMAARSNPPLRIVGHDGGINIANGVREYHGAIIGRNPNARFRHVTPACASLARTEFVQREIYEALGLRPEPGAYPADWIAGRGTAGRPFSMEWDPRCPSQALEVTGYAGGAKTAASVIRELDGALAERPDARHVRIAVLADKTSFIRGLAEAGFLPAAYLPAWYWRNASRYDCVLLVRRNFVDEPASDGLDEAVSRFSEGLSSC